MQTIRVDGLWDVSKFQAFAAEIARGLPTLTAGGPFDVLIDASEFPVQSPAIADAFNDILTRGRAVNTGYTAIIRSSMLGKLQAERALRHERLGVFLDRVSAEAWLIERRKGHDRD